MELESAVQYKGKNVGKVVPFMISRGGKAIQFNTYEEMISVLAEKDDVRVQIGDSEMSIRELRQTIVAGTPAYPTPEALKIHRGMFDDYIQGLLDGVNHKPVQGSDMSALGYQKGSMNSMGARGSAGGIGFGRGGY